MIDQTYDQSDQPNKPPVPARVTKVSPLTGKKRTLEIPQYTPEEFERRLYAYERMHIDFDDALPLLSDAAKLFVTRGFTVDEWEEYESRL
jgi:hypothetical protein